MTIDQLLGIGVAIVVVVVIILMAWKLFSSKLRDKKNYARALKMVPMLIHLPPSTDDVQVGGRDEREVIGEQLSEAQVMYSIISSTVAKGFKTKLYGQKHVSFEIVAHDGTIKYYAVVPAVLTETIKQAITASYPTARLEEVPDPNFFSEEGKIHGVAGGELRLKEDFWYPIASYEDTKRDASLGIINAMSTAKKGDGIAIQILFRPTDGGWTKKSTERVQNIKDGKKSRKAANGIGKIVNGMGNLVGDIAEALWKPPEEHEKYKAEDKQLTNLQQEEIQRIEEKTKHPGFETLIRIVASSGTKARSEALLSSVVSVFSQFDLPQYNGFKYDITSNAEELARNYVLRWFPQEQSDMVLNSVELASIFHLPSQNAIPTSQVERQATKQVDGPSKLAEDGVILGVNKFRGEEKIIRLRDKDRRRHTYVIGSTGMGKSILLTNIAYQDMCDGRGFAFIDPHGDAIELLLSKVPQERMDDIIVFEPGNMDNPVGMNMFEYNSEDQKDFIVQEGINMLTSLYDPGNQGIFGPRAQHMFRNAALLLMSDPSGGTFIDIPRCFIDPEFVKSKLKFVKDKTVYDYWTKEFPASQKSSDAGEVTSWFVSKWGPFLSNKMMRNILGQTESGFNIRKIMDEGKILLINLSKGKTGELNAKLLGMIFVMKFQAAAMSRQDIPEDERKDFCLFVDEFQNFATESFESILSEARKYRLNLVLANQFMTQLTDKIREALLGNVGTIMSGRLGVTDAELMEKAFSPVFTAEDLHKQPNFCAIATVMMFDMPTSPFTISLLPPMGDSSDELMQRMKAYALSKYGRPRAEVEAEIDARLAVAVKPAEKKPEPAASAPAPTAEAATPAPAPVSAPAAPVQKKNFLDAWLDKKAALEAKAKEEAKQAVVAQAASAKAATPAPKPVEKSVMNDLENDGDGSTWVATAVKNVEAAPAQAAPAAAPVVDDKFAEGVKIKHDRATAPAPTEKPAATPVQAANNNTTQVQQDEDGVTLRWR
ncbi:type IV secretory system conjugative DNA transfer family protein [Candidatus Saccharibacteria bacterium]|nr:type IV secretory system conjugative DNA transfer family protein [Candidatus Saccharibacteria bacterium]